MMCSRHRPLNGADSAPIPPGPVLAPTDRVMAAYGRCVSALAARDVAAVVYELRAMADPAEKEMLAAMLEADPEPEVPASREHGLTCRACRRSFPSFANLERHACHPRGQALVEFALVTPLLVLLIVGGMMLALAMIDRQSLTWQAQEGALAAAMAGAEDSACDDARAAVAAVGGRSVASCDGSEGLRMDYEPAASPPTVRITLAGGVYPIPFLDSVTVTADAAAVIRPASPSASPSPSPLPSTTP